MPGDLRGQAEVYKWLMFEAANMGAMAGELYHYECVAEESFPYVLTGWQGLANARQCPTGQTSLQPK